MRLQGKAVVSEDFCYTFTSPKVNTHHWTKLHPFSVTVYAFIAPTIIFGNKEQYQTSKLVAKFWTKQTSGFFIASVYE